MLLLLVGAHVVLGMMVMGGGRIKWIIRPLLTIVVGVVGRGVPAIIAVWLSCVGGLLVPSTRGPLKGACIVIVATTHH